MHLRLLAPALGICTLAALFACSSSKTDDPVGGGIVDQPETGTMQPPVTTEAGAPVVDLLPGCTKDPGAPAATVDPNAAADPTGGADKFTLAMALAGYPAGAGKLTAAINTEKGIIKCELSETAAPISVANFVGLARGTRPFKDTKGKWKLAHFYDGLTWHRVLKDFVIQGGDPDGDGTGGPGYDLVKENQIDEPLGTLAMAASANVSGSQFYVVIGKGPAAKYNVFGTCSTENAIPIADVPADRNGFPNTPIHILQVQIGRCP